jgi:pyruvate dehydrogenase E1 component alpha subunit
VFDGHFEGDAITYRTDEETEDIKMNKDPLKIFKAKVTEAGLLEASQLEEIDKESNKKIKQSIIESKEADFPKEADLLTDVYISY